MTFTGTLDIRLLGIVFFWLMVATGLIQLLFYWIVFRRFAFLRKYTYTSLRQPVSVIVCARNEARNLEHNIPLLVGQDYPDFELIVVNDCSWDDTADVLDKLVVQYPQLKVVTIKEQERYSHGKKFAITLGIKASKHEWLLFTDADCRPSSPAWISSMEQQFSKEKEIVLGYGAYERKPGILNHLIRFDTSMIAIQYFSFALGGNAYMGVGRNLAYRKSLFFRNKGFAKHNHLPSGDDDLLINETATPDNVAIEVRQDGFTYSLPKTTFSGWFSQKARHMTTSKLYKGRHRFSLGMHALSMIVFYVSVMVVLSLRYHLMESAMTIGIVMASKWLIYGMSASRLKEKNLIVLFPIFEVVLTFLQPLFFIAQLFTKKRSWR